MTLISWSRSCQELTRFFIARFRAFSSSASCSACVTKTQGQESSFVNAQDLTNFSFPVESAS